MSRQGRAVHHAPRRRFPGDDAAFKRAVDEAKQRKNISDVVGRHTKLKPRGRSEMVGLCPFHDERTPSFEVNDAKGTFHCHGCGAGGDIVSFLMAADKMTFMEAVRALASDLFPDVTPEQRAKAVEEDRAARAQAIGDARDMWARCIDPRGTPAETYLRQARGITIDLPPCLRFGIVPTSRDNDGNWKRPWPALVLACTDGAGALTGLQRVFLADDGSDKRWGKRSKFSLGRPRGSAVKIGMPEDGAPPPDILICEGPEDGLSLAQELDGVPVWIALGTAMMPFLELPAGTPQVTIAGQNDAPGRAATDKAIVALVDRGVRVRTMYPAPSFKDWNDQLRGIAS